MKRLDLILQIGKGKGGLRRSCTNQVISKKLKYKTHINSSEESKLNLN